MNVPFLDRKQSGEVDRLMVERYGVATERMMEIAGWQIADFVRRFPVSRVLIVCGKGNNGGDGLCAARYLFNRGYDVRLFLAEPEKLGEEAKKQLDILKRMGMGYFSELEKLDQEAKEADLMVDALLGYNLIGNPKSPYDDIIRIVNSANVPVVAVDVPSGWDCENGTAMLPCVRATHVLCLGFPKKGLDGYAGEVHVADIGIPKALWKETCTPFINLFREESIIRIKPGR